MLCSSGRTSRPLAPSCASQILNNLPAAGTKRKQPLASHLVGHFPLQHLSDFHSSSTVHTEGARILMEKGGSLKQAESSCFSGAGKSTASMLSPSAPPSLRNGPSLPPSSTASSCLGSYRGCFTSIFIFCFGVRSPCRMTAITQRSSILGKHKIHLANTSLHPRIVTSSFSSILLTIAFPISGRTSSRLNQAQVPRL